MKRHRNHISVKGIDYYYEWRVVSSGIYRLYWIGDDDCKKIMLDYIHHSGLLPSIVLREGKTYFEICEKDTFDMVMKNIKL